jgi:hypothetical protein
MCVPPQLECTLDRLREVVAARLWRLLVVESCLLEVLTALKRDYLQALLPAASLPGNAELHVAYEPKSPLHLVRYRPVLGGPFVHPIPVPMPVPSSCACCPPAHCKCSMLVSNLCLFLPVLDGILLACLLP